MLRQNKAASSIRAQTTADKYARQYIADYEGADDDTDDDTDDLDLIDEAIKALIVADTDNLQNKDDSESVKYFITSFGMLEPQSAFDTTTKSAFDITTDLANQSLTHALTCKDIASDSTTTINSTTTTIDTTKAGAGQCAIWYWLYAINWINYSRG
jgi:hypothetical protein